jgi:Na+/H+ antiporter NhaD/arsenite permease-like protein
MATLLIILFIAGYTAIAFEHSIRVNKAATALITGVLCWVVYIMFTENKGDVTAELSHHLGDISQILFFLMGAMAIVELIDAHNGFDIITQRIRTTNKGKLVWVIGIVTFFLSAFLDNLTTSIIMVSLVRKLVEDKQDRWILAGLIIIAANAGGAWSPIGDVTTTMLWIGNQVTAGNIIVKLIGPSLVCLFVSIFLIRGFFRGSVQRPVGMNINHLSNDISRRESNIILVTGLFLLLMVPVFKSVTHLPPFMGILIALGILWLVTEIIHGEKDEAERKKFSVAYALRKIDTPGILFFLGILLAVSALQTTGQLSSAAGWMDTHLQNKELIVIMIGGLSAIVDNVPLVAATQGMYSLEVYPTDHYIWEFLAYCTGTGGSMLIIGSAAGIATMGIEKIDFIWYLKRIGWVALIGYLAGAAVYILQHRLLAA